MEVVITAAVSLDGFISTLDGNSDWVRDDELLESTVANFGCIVLGRTTFEQYPDDYPIGGIVHLVLSSQASESNKDVHYVTSVETAINKAKELGFEKLLVIGGSKTNESFISSGLVTKLLLNVHPTILGMGKRLFGDYDKKLKLKMIECTHNDDFMHTEYTFS